MPLFSYRAVDSDGTPVDGTMDETSAARVAAILDERGLQVSQIEPVTQRQGLLSLKRQLGWQDIQTLNDQLLAVTKSHLPLVPALESMAHDIKSPRLRSVLRDMRAELEQGRSIEEALGAHADQIPHTYRSLIRAGLARRRVSVFSRSLAEEASSQTPSRAAGVREAVTRCAETRRLHSLRNRLGGLRRADARRT
jgi:general secretion pathway protein F